MQRESVVRTEWEGDNPEGKSSGGGGGGGQDER